MTTRELYYEELAKDGAFCPTCDRWGKIYPRRINKTMVRTLAWLWKLSNYGITWVDVPKEARKVAGTYDYTKQYSTLKYWGFLDHKPNKHNPFQKESGIWRPTSRAGQFLRGEIAVPEMTLTYNQQYYGCSDKLVYVQEIIKGFNYPEIMQTHATTLRAI